MQPYEYALWNEYNVTRSTGTCHIDWTHHSKLTPTKIHITIVQNRNPN